MARGSTQSQGRVARSEIGTEPTYAGSPKGDRPKVYGGVNLPFIKETRSTLPTYVVEEINAMQKSVQAEIAKGNQGLIERGEKEFADRVRREGGDPEKLRQQLSKDKLWDDITGKERRKYYDRFQEELKGKGNAVLMRDDPDLKEAVNNFYQGIKAGVLQPRLVMGADGNGYVPSGFGVEYSDKHKGYELVRYGNPLLNTDDPNDYSRDKDWFVIKAPKGDRSVISKMEKMAVVFNNFVESP